MIDPTTKIIVLIPHYNNPQGLIKSLCSIDEEIPVDVLIVDDGSDLPPEIAHLEKYFSSGKIIMERLPHNQGIEHALNAGIAIIFKNNYDFIARLDCGDRCAKGRFEKQAKSFKQDDKIGLIGSWVKFISDSGSELFNYQTPTTYASLREKMFINCMFIHPSVMMRTTVLRQIGYYSSDYKAAEDYDLFFRIIKKFKCINLPEYLVFCEFSAQGISSTKRNIQLKSRLRIILKNFYFGFYPIYGLLRNLCIFIIPVGFIKIFKKHAFRPGSF